MCFHGVDRNSEHSCDLRCPSDLDDCEHHPEFARRQLKLLSDGFNQGWPVQRRLVNEHRHGCPIESSRPRPGARYKRENVDDIPFTCGRYKRDGGRSAVKSFVALGSVRDGGTKNGATLLVYGLQSALDLLEQMPFFERRLAARVHVRDAAISSQEKDSGRKCIDGVAKKRRLDPA